MKFVLLVVISLVLTGSTALTSQAKDPDDPRIIVVKEFVTKVLALGRDTQILLDKDIDNLVSEVIYDTRLPNESEDDRKTRVSRSRNFFRGFARMEREKTEKIGTPFYEITYTVPVSGPDKGSLVVEVNFSPHEPTDRTVKGYRFIVEFVNKELAGNKLLILTVSKTALRIPGLVPGIVV